MNPQKSVFDTFVQPLLPGVIPAIEREFALLNQASVTADDVTEVTRQIERRMKAGPAFDAELIALVCIRQAQMRALNQKALIDSTVVQVLAFDQDKNEKQWVTVSAIDLQVGDTIRLLANGEESKAWTFGESTVEFELESLPVASPDGAVYTLQVPGGEFPLLNHAKEKKAA